MHHVVFVQVGENRKVVQCDVIHVIGFQVALQLETFPINLNGRIDLKGEIGPAYKPYDQDLQKILTDMFVIRRFILGLSQHSVHVKDEIILFLSAVEDDMLLFLLKRKRYILYADGDVFQRILRGGALRVQYIGVDDDEVVFADGIFLILDEECTVAVLYIEQLGKGMGMGDAGPVVFIFGM